jgi:predicted signal transduction protein with EAL and GGDEF domain
MATVEALEERLAAVEAEVRRLRDQRENHRAGVIGRTNPELINEMFGIFADDPLFERMVQRMEAERERERREAEAEDAG